jgi:hypothetical protein
MFWLYRLSGAATPGTHIPPAEVLPRLRTLRQTFRRDHTRAAAEDFVETQMKEFLPSQQGSIIRYSSLQGKASQI